MQDGARCQVANRGGLDRRPRGGGDTRCVEGLFRKDLVERHLAGVRAGSGVRDAEEVEQSLHRSVFAFVAVQRDVARENPCSGERFNEWTVCRVQHERVVAARDEAVITRCRERSDTSRSGERPPASTAIRSVFIRTTRGGRAATANSARTSEASMPDVRRAYRFAYGSTVNSAMGGRW
jgi:hypothetical protein